MELIDILGLSLRFLKEATNYNLVKSAGFLEDLKVKYPDKSNDIQESSDKFIELGLPLNKQKVYLEWLIRNANGEPYEDIVGDLYTFFNAKNNGKISRVDIVQIKSVNELRELLESISPKKNYQQASGDVDKIYDDGEWMVIMPMTREASIYYGQGTTWCTAKRSGKNLFYNYVARNEDTILYYIIGKEKLALGTLNGKIEYTGDGGLSVDSKNVGLTLNRLYDILGKDRADEIIRIIENHAKTMQGRHPAKKVIEKARTSLPITKYLMKDLDDEGKSDMKEIILERGISKNVGEYLGVNNPIQIIENQTEEACRLAVQEYGNAIRYIENPSEEACRLAVQQNGFVIRYIKNPSEEVCKLAVQKYGDAIKYIKNPSEEVCKLAVQENGYAIQYIKNQTEEVCKLAVQKYGDTIEYIKNQTEELCRLAIQQNGLAIQYIENQTEELCRLAVQQNGNAIQYIKNQTEKLCKLAVQQNGCAIKYIISPSEEVCKLAVQQIGDSIEYIKNPSEEVCRLAVQQNRDAIQFIKDPSETVKQLAGI